MHTPSCSVCRFALASAPSMDLAATKMYACRRYPPTTHIVGNPAGEPIVASAYPTVKGDNWCGEYDRPSTVDAALYTIDEHL